MRGSSQTSSEKIFLYCHHPLFFLYPLTFPPYPNECIAVRIKVKKFINIENFLQSTVHHYLFPIP